VTKDGTLRLTLDDVTLGPPSADEVIVKVEAAPINPSDLGLLLGPANVSTLRASGTAERPMLAFEELGRFYAPVTGENPVLLVDQDGIREAERLNTSRNLADLLGRMNACVPFPWPQHVDLDELEPLGSVVIARQIARHGLAVRSCSCPSASISRR